MEKLIPGSSEALPEPIHGSELPERTDLFQDSREGIWRRGRTVGAQRQGWGSKENLPHGEKQYKGFAIFGTSGKDRNFRGVQSSRTGEFEKLGEITNRNFRYYTGTSGKCNFPVFSDCRETGILHCSELPVGDRNFRKVKNASFCRETKEGTNGAEPLDLI